MPAMLAMRIVKYAPTTRWRKRATILVPVYLRDSQYGSIGTMGARRFGHRCRIHRLC